MNVFKRLWDSVSNLAGALNELSATVRAVAVEVRERTGIETEEGNAVLRLSHPDPDGAPSRRSRK